MLTGKKLNGAWQRGKYSFASTIGSASTTYGRFIGELDDMIFDLAISAHDVKQIYFDFTKPDKPQNTPSIRHWKLLAAHKIRDEISGILNRLKTEAPCLSELHRVDKLFGRQGAPVSTRNHRRGTIYFEAGLELCARGLSDHFAHTSNSALQYICHPSKVRLIGQLLLRKRLKLHPWLVDWHIQTVMGTPYQTGKII